MCKLTNQMELYHSSIDVIFDDGYFDRASHLSEAFHVVHAGFHCMLDVISEGMFTPLSLARDCIKVFIWIVLALVGLLRLFREWMGVREHLVVQEQLEEGGPSLPRGLSDE